MEEEKNYEMYDIHMHIIPGVDDGAWNMTTSLAMAGLAFEQGIRGIIATPHNRAFDFQSKKTEQGFAELKEHIERMLPAMKICLGGEIRCSERKMSQVLEKLQSGLYPSLNGTKYVLMELTVRTEAAEAGRCAATLLNNGWIPVIAHAERYKRLFLDAGVIPNLKQMGCLIQMNVYSILEEQDPEVKRNAIDLVQREQVDFLGTDAHRMNYRPPSAAAGLHVLYSMADQEYADRIAFRNARELLGM